MPLIVKSLSTVLIPLIDDLNKCANPPVSIILNFLLVCFNISLIIFSIKPV
jgi:hypothetical protein